MAVVVVRWDEVDVNCLSCHLLCGRQFVIYHSLHLITLATAITIATAIAIAIAATAATANLSCPLATRRVVTRTSGSANPQC